MSETITFEFELKPTYWDRPPHVEVMLNGNTMLKQDVVELTTIRFTSSVDFNKTHTLAIKRSGKDDSQCCEDENGNWLDVNVPADHVRYSVYARWMKNND